MDKTDPDLVQRYKFSTRVQQPDETTEDFVLALKLQAEYCNFENFKETAILDRLIAGLRDRALRQKLLSEEKLKLASAEKIIATWEVAKANAGTAEPPRDLSGMIAAMGNHSRPEYGVTLGKIAQVYSAASRYKRENGGSGDSRGPVKDRLGHRPYARVDQAARGRQQTGFRGRRFNGYGEQRPDYSQFVCDFCGVKGHIKKNCFKVRNLQRDAVNLVDSCKPGPSTDRQINELLSKMRTVDSEDELSDTGEIQCMLLSSINKISNPCLVQVKVEGKCLEMEIDCGSSGSVISKRQYFKAFDKPLQNCSNQLIVVNGGKLKIAGEVMVSVQFNGKNELMSLLVLDCENTFFPLFGRTWLDIFYQDWRHYFKKSLVVNNLQNESSKMAVQEIKKEYSQVFKKNFSLPVEGYKAELVMKEGTPIFKKAYEVPYRLRDRVADYLDRLEREKVITPIDTSQWASPIIVVMKKNDDIRLVIDCKVSLNKLLVPNTYPLPTAQDIFANLAGCKVFCALDLEGAYTQLELSERSKKLVVINTMKGLYTYNRLPQGASSSASIFQQVMDKILEGLENVSCYLDDVLIAGKPEKSAMPSFC